MGNGADPSYTRDRWRHKVTHAADNTKNTSIPRTRRRPIINWRMEPEEGRLTMERPELVNRCDLSGEVVISDMMNDESGGVILSGALEVVSVLSS